MSLERDPWSETIYNGFSRSPGEVAATPRRMPAPRRSSRRGFAIAGMAVLALGGAIAVAGVPLLARLWSGVPPQAAVSSVLPHRQMVEATVPAAPAPPPFLALAPHPQAMSSPAPAAAEARPLPVAEPAKPPKAPPKRRAEKRQPGISSDARLRAAAATTAANLEAAYAPLSTLSAQAAALAHGR